MAVTHHAASSAPLAPRYEGPLVSADSHVIEQPDLWAERLPKALRDHAPGFPLSENPFQAQPGGHDPQARLSEMEQDGVTVEVLYPSLALNLFHVEDAALQAACFRVYNDWLTEYCTASPQRLVGIAAISAYEPDQAVEEMQRARDNGLRGALLWQVPPEPLAFHTRHHEQIWAAAADLEMPVSLHILTGHDWSLRVSKALRQGRIPTPEEDTKAGMYGLRGPVNYKLLSVTNALHDIILSGVLERHPDVRVVVVENEIGWVPFVLNQWDKYCARQGQTYTSISRPPSEFFEEQVLVTFFNDPPGTKNLGWWGHDNAMWSSDYPHPNSTWPNSRDIVTRDLGALPREVQDKLAWRTCCAVYEIDEDKLKGVVA